MRQNITSTVEVIGAVLVSIGAFLIWTPFGFIVTGALLIAGGALSA
jgi:hypothetical protein